jgi:dimethylargininase
VLTAITRAISPRMNQCELTFLKRQPIDIALAVREHQQYEIRLRDLGVTVISLPGEPDLPDAVFVEDPVVVLDEVAVLTRMGAGSRRPEAESLAIALAPFRPILRLHDPATLEGGDVMRVGRTLYVGKSVRTNAEGIRQLTDEIAPFGYTVKAVPIDGCMHLKTGCSYLGNDTLLVNREWIDPAAFPGFRILDVAPGEAWAANVLKVGDTLLMPDAFPATATLLRQQGFAIQTLGVSELMKAEAGLTCMSVLFDSAS